MEHRGINEDVNRAASAALAGDASGASRLVELLLPRVDKATAMSRLRWEVRPVRDHNAFDIEVVNCFLEEKLAAPGYVQELASSDAPVALVRKTIERLTIDHLREEGNVDYAARPRQDDEGGTLDLSHQLEDSFPTPQELKQHGEGIQRMMSVVDELTPEDQLLLEVVHADLCQPRPEHVRALAQRRGVSPKAVRQKLRVRAVRLDGARQNRDGKGEQHSDYLAKCIYSAKQQIHKVRCIIAEQDGVAAEPEAKLTPARREQFRGSNTALINATPEERSTYLVFLDQLLVTYSERARKATAALHADLPDKDWDEAVVILGMVTGSSGKKDRKRAVNTLTRRYCRLLEQIRSRREELTDEEEP